MIIIFVYFVLCTLGVCALWFVLKKDEKKRVAIEIKALKEKIDSSMETKPAEWSEEDDAVFGDLMWCIEQAKKFAKDENDMGNIWFAENWLKKRIKFLRPCQPCEVDDNDKEMEERMIENYMEGRES